MKRLFTFFLLLLAGLVHSQSKRLNEDEKKILTIELNNKATRHLNDSSLKKVIGDSILIGKRVMHYERSPEELKKWIVMMEQLPVEDINEIFGDGTTFFPEDKKDKKNWMASDFPDYKISFYDEENKNPKRMVLQMHDPLFLSLPVIRNDGKFAYVHIASEHIGGVLNIYRKEGNKWLFYKGIQLYFI